MDTQAVIATAETMVKSTLELLGRLRREEAKRQAGGRDEPIYDILVDGAIANLTVAMLYLQGIKQERHENEVKPGD